MSLNCITIHIPWNIISEHIDYKDMATHVSKSANRALARLVTAKSKSFGGLPFSSFTKLFDTMVLECRQLRDSNMGN